MRNPNSREKQQPHRLTGTWSFDFLLNSLIFIDNENEKIIAFLNLLPQNCVCVLPTLFKIPGSVLSSIGT